jgi:hypothetical protein
MSTDFSGTFERCPHDRENPYAQINRALIRDKSISPNCRWFLIYCLSYDNAWKISIPYFMKEQNISKDKMYSIINEALEAGYMKRESYLQKGLKRYRYFIAESPKFKKFLLCPEKPDTENQDSTKEQGRTKEQEEGEEKNKQKEKNANSAAASSLCVLLLSKIKEKKKNFSKTIMPSWLKAAEKLVKIRSLDEITKVINFAMEHDFWFKNILSPEKLLKHLDVLELEMVKPTPRASSSSPIKAAENKELVKKIINKFPETIKNGHIVIGRNYIEFIFGTMLSNNIKFDDHGFDEQVMSSLRKMGLPLEGL